MAEGGLFLQFVIENFMDDTTDTLSLFLSRQLTSIGISLIEKLRRDHIPRITNYAEHVIPQFTDFDFRFHFRITRNMFEEILRILGPHISTDNAGGHEETEPRKQLLVFLCYMANQESMREISHYFGISKSTVHRVIRNVGETITERLVNVIQWPDNNSQQIISREFQLKSALPGIIGALDGTHIRLSACPDSDQDYVNRKSFPSMQLQVVVDDKMMIRDAYSGWPGSTHDARVLRNSSLFRNAETGIYFNGNNYIIADSAYPLKPWLITPFRDNGHLGPQQRRFNRVLSSTRQIVERSIGHLKGRFRRLREITVHSPAAIVITIIAGCILHNLCILHEDNVEDFIEYDVDGHPNNYVNIFQNAAAGVHRRNQLMHMLP